MSRVETPGNSKCGEPRSSPIWILTGPAGIVRPSLDVYLGDSAINKNPFQLLQAEQAECLGA